MTSALTASVAVAGLGALLAALAWLGARVRRRGIGGAVLGPVEELYHPAAHRSRAEITTQVIRSAPTPDGGPDRRPPGPAGR